MRLAGRQSGPMFDARHDHGEERQRMTDDTELYGADGGRRDGFDREYLMLMQMAREQKLRLWQDRGVFRLDDAGDDTVFTTDLAGPDALAAIGAFLAENDDGPTARRHRRTS